MNSPTTSDIVAENLRLRLQVAKLTMILNEMIGVSMKMAVTKSEGQPTVFAEYREIQQRLHEQMTELLDGQ